VSHAGKVVGASIEDDGTTIVHVQVPGHLAVRMSSAATLNLDPEPARALAAPPDEDVARLINGLVEAGDLLYGHVQRIAWDPAAANMARECWLESRAALSGDHEPKYVAPPAPGTTAATPPKEDRHE
jgi:hypothetical protein